MIYFGIDPEICESDGLKKWGPRQLLTHFSFSFVQNQHIVQQKGGFQPSEPHEFPHCIWRFSNCMSIAEC